LKKRLVGDWKKKDWLEIEKKIGWRLEEKRLVGKRLVGDLSLCFGCGI